MDDEINIELAWDGCTMTYGPCLSDVVNIEAIKVFLEVERMIIMSVSESLGLFTSSVFTISPTASLASLAVNCLAVI